MNGWWNNHGLAIERFGTADSCAASCNHNNNCIAFNYHTDQSCYHYDSIGAPYHNGDSIACVKEKRNLHLTMKFQAILVSHVRTKRNLQNFSYTSGKEISLNVRMYSAHNFQRIIKPSISSSLRLVWETYDARSEGGSPK